MQKKIALQVSPLDAQNPEAIKDYLAQAEGIESSHISGFFIVKKSIDARNKNVKINITANAYINEPFEEREKSFFTYKNVSKALHKVIIVGTGPAGLFAALALLEKGVKPILIERGKNIRDRRRDLANLNKQGSINPESNYCFGEGGAGTYSDGKLYTRSNKRGSIDKVLNQLHSFGADENILYTAHPHIGTNKLPEIISNIRKCILDNGGEIHFETKLLDFEIEKNEIKKIITQREVFDDFKQVILATGHSARDVFELLHAKNIFIEAKPFALGVRVEHPQHIIDRVQYHCQSRSTYLPPASYSLVEQVNGTGVFSFCMCPGGIIAPASTDNNELVVNGWSPSKRNNPFANSGMVVEVQEKNFSDFAKYGTLAAMHFQKTIEQKAFAAGGGGFVAPAARLVDFCENKISASLPDCSYLPGIAAADMQAILPTFILHPLQQAFKAFGKKLRDKNTQGFFYK